MKAANVAVLMLVGGLATAGGGWYSAELPEELIADELAVVRPSRPPAAIEGQGPKLQAAIDTIRKLGLAVEPSLEAPPQGAADLAPPPDVEAMLSLALKAIMREADGYALLVQDAASGANVKLRSGQQYFGGWRLVGITPSEITLKKGADVKTVPVMLRTDALPAAEPAPPAP